MEKIKIKSNYLKFKNWNMEKIKIKSNYLKFKHWNMEKIKMKNHYQKFKHFTTIWMIWKIFHVKMFDKWKKLVYIQDVIMHDFNKGT